MLNKNNKKKIVLVHSGRRGRYLHVPLGVLCIAEALSNAGYEPCIFDLRIQDISSADLEDALFMGVSHMTGSMQIPPALACARMAKKNDLPVIFGGTHASILLEETALHSLVDIAVKGEGEEVIVELAEYFQGKREIDSIKSIAYKNETNEIIRTGDRHPPVFDKVVHLPYHLLPMEKYLATAIDFAYQSSRGCPHRCVFCAEVALFSKQWRSKSAEVMIEEIEKIIFQFNPNRINFVDSNFFCNKNRVKEFCRLVLAQKIKTRFFAECRFDYFCDYDEEFIDLIKRAGFVEIEFGGESGSNQTLSIIKKDITREQIIKSIRMCKKSNLKSFTSFMVGFPGECKHNLMDTINIYDEIKKIDPQNTRINGMFVYSPFPGTELYEKVIKEWNYVPPKSLEEWAKFKLYDPSGITWLSEKEKQSIKTISIIVRYFFVLKTIVDWTFKEKTIRHKNIIYALLSILFNLFFYPFAKIRWSYRLFGYGYEWIIWEKIFTLYMGRK